MNVSTIRLMLWLKLTLSWRMHRSSKLRTLSVVLFFVMMVPLIMLAFGLHWLLGYAPPSSTEPIMRDAFAIIYLLWILAPLLGFQMNESYDLTKLFTYPLSYWHIFLGSVLGGLIDPPVLLASAPLIALWLSSTSGLLTGIVDAFLIFLFLLQTVSTAQAITVVLIGFLRSRRFRDITMVVFPVIGLGYYVGQQALVHQFSYLRFGSLGLFTAAPWRVADFLPPGFVASGMHAMATGNWPVLLVSTGALIVATMISTAVAAATLRRLYLGDVIVADSAPEATQRSTSSLGSGAPAWLPADIAALAGKELSYLRRDPQYKAVLVQMVYGVAAIAVPFLMTGSGMSWNLSRIPLVANFRLFGVAAALVLATSPLIFNLFGAEGAAVTVLFSFPTARRHILIAKNIAHSITLLTLNLVGLSVAAAVTGLWSGLPLVVTGVVIALPILLSAGNLVSIRLPHRMMVRGQRWQRGGASMGGDSAGCAYAFLYLLAYMATGVAVAPVLLALTLPSFASTPVVWYAIALPLACLYSVAIYGLLLGVAEGWLMGREPEIATAVMPPD